eukprot:TRINITY_DN20939_c0_g1_i1.p1 TRINITY_DN20939_c0_g1~~TRINITY_DN20939_c0_g1_i1.p1  ORF type:complete len:228 (-),score=41.23 TRINITY_DN20939_c0_g1_i1:243-926(-)
MCIRDSINAEYGVRRFAHGLACTFVHSRSSTTERSMLLALRHTCRRVCAPARVLPNRLSTRGAAMCTLTHISSSGSPEMVDVSHKDISTREACARSVIALPPNIAALLQSDPRELHSAKGPVLATATIAGTMAAKKTSELIPFCHPVGVESCKFKYEFNAERSELELQCTVRTSYKTGVEMEALTGASVAALTFYDMCKAMSHDIVIKQTQLLRKTGGKSDVLHPTL